MREQLDEVERQARRRRLVIILVVGGLLVGGLLTFVYVVNRSLTRNTETAIDDLRPQWRSIDLQELNTSYRAAASDAYTSGKYDALDRAFPRTAHATFTGAVFDKPNEVDAVYSVDGMGVTRCLYVAARGTAPPNRVVFSTGHSRC